MLEPAPLPKERLEALTDGIFAVSMTILVLDLKLPTLPVAGEEVWQAVLAAIPRSTTTSSVSCCCACSGSAICG